VRPLRRPPLRQRAFSTVAAAAVRRELHLQVSGPSIGS
jgi:hypothetical protein